MKTHFKKLRNPNYVGSWDLADTEGNYHDRVVTITGVKVEAVHDGKGGTEDCTVVTLQETKPMVANSTNLKTIARICASNFIEDWAGKQIGLTVQRVKAFGEMHDAIRVKAPSTQPKPKPTLTAERFAAALEAITAGKTTAKAVRDQFTLTPEQDGRL